MFLDKIKQGVNMGQIVIPFLKKAVVAVVSTIIMEKVVSGIHKIVNI